MVFGGIWYLFGGGGYLAVNCLVLDPGLKHGRQHTIRRQDLEDDYHKDNWNVSLTTFLKCKKSNT